MEFRPSLEEIEIIKGCLKNDRKSQKMLFERYKDAMYTIAYRILRDEDLASDAIQEGFIRVFGGLGNYGFCMFKIPHNGSISTRKLFVRQ